MKKFLKWSYKTLRATFMTIVVLLVVAYSALYLALSMPYFQNKIKAIGERELSEFLDTKVSIDGISISPFNQVVLTGVNIPDQNDGKLINVDKLGAGISLYDLVINRKLVFTFAEVNGLHGHVTRPDKDSPTNLQFIIDKLKPKPGKPPKPYDIKIQHAILRNCDISYDVLNEPHKSPGVFDPNHLHATDLVADLSFPRIKNNDFIIDVERLAVNEKNGLQVKNVKGLFSITDQSASFSDLVVDLPGTHIAPADATFHFTSLGNAINEIKQQPLTLDMTDNYITPADFKTFVPKLAQWADPVHFTVDAVVTRDMIDVKNLQLNARNGNVALDLAGKFTNFRTPRVMDFDVRHIDLKASRGEIARLTQNFAHLTPQAQAIVDKCGSVHLVGNAKGSLSDLTADAKLNTDLGDVALKGTYNTDGRSRSVNARVSSGGFNLGRALSKEGLLGMVAADVNVDASLLSDKNIVGNINGKVDHIDLKGYRYHNIVADVDVDHNNYSGMVTINDPNGMVDLKGGVVLDGANSSYAFDLIAKGVNFAKLNLTDKYSANALNVNMAASISGNNIDNLAGHVKIDDMSFINSQTGKGFHVSNLEVDASDSGDTKRMTIDTDFLHGSVEGQYNFASLVPAVKSIASKCFPQFMSGHTPPTTGNNNFAFNIEVDPNEEFENYISSYVKLPVKPAYKATIDGYFNENDKDLAVDIDMPYLIQGSRLIEGTKIHVGKESHADNVTMTAQTIFPSDKGNLLVNIDANAINDGVDANLNWVLNRPTDYHGNVSLSAQLGRDFNGKFMTHVDINPTEVVINDGVWNINEGHLDYRNGVITVDDINGSRGDQFINIVGKVSRNPDDMLTVALNDIRLDYIFETLKINHVTFGGSATGEFQLADLFSKSPRLSTENLHVEDMTYNGAHMGDGDIKSRFDVENTAVLLNCDLTQKNGLHTYINGEIFAAADSLNMEFIANKANVEFMKPFMEAFTDEVHGEVSGRAVLFGNFKTIDLYGDVYADDLSLKIGYTNVTYHCTDSVHIEPGLIAFKDITISDRDHHTAKLNGWLRHDAFHNPEFNFTVTDAQGLLVYDITPAMNPDWYGTVYGNGTAIVAGEPGEVRIGVNMETVDKSKFTFVLSDTEVANEYNFITFRDRDKKDAPQVVAADTVKSHFDELPQEVKSLLAKRTVNNVQQAAAPTRFTIDLQADITPEAEIVLVMDPVGGDRIRAFGSGNLRLNYNSIDDSFDMFGKYVLEKGSYNFTLQDIIIKDFTIRDGSTISFNGNPYNANLDINAVYSLNANLSDLDNSFSTDRDINRTNVPVNAILKVKGDISEPTLSYDLEFPSLTSDAYSKVRSVISTDEMMMQQIIYLLALNRFYTPDYMQSTKNNNELTSVASSTISSQISSILGQLSDNWRISPNLRSNKGDFSDVEVDLALSSQLLNNRLIFNGNFGYRDNTYNTRNSNFIGDFDLEYLLNRKGTIRLKAYNHFNDQNYYVRDAMTTQGVGVVFKHDFDRILGKKQQPHPQPEPADTVAAKAATVSDDNLLIITPRKPEDKE